MNKRLRKLQDEKAVAVEKKVRKPRKTKVKEIIIPEPHDHLVQLNCKCTPQPLRDFHYFNDMNNAARREDGKVIHLTQDWKGI